MTVKLDDKAGSLGSRMSPRLPTLPRALLSLALTLAFAPIAGCAARTVAGSKAAEEPLPNDMEGTLAALERAEAELRGALGPALGAASAPPEAPESAPAPPSDDEDQQDAPAPMAQAAEETASGTPAGSDPCAVACRALASMRRATDHLCGLAGEQDGRCASARERVRGADERVRASCPRCAE